MDSHDLAKMLLKDPNRKLSNLIVDEILNGPGKCHVPEWLKKRSMRNLQKLEAFCNEEDWTEL